VTTSRFCEQCGTPLGDGLAFCESCGAAVPTGAPANPVAPTAPAPAPAPVEATPVPVVEPTAAPATAGRASPRWVPLTILVVGFLVIVASIVSAR